MDGSVGEVPALVQDTGQRDGLATLRHPAPGRESVGPRVPEEIHPTLPDSRDSSTVPPHISAESDVCVRVGPRSALGRTDHED